MRLVLFGLCSVLTFLLSSCVNYREDTTVIIQQSCNLQICSFKLVQAEVSIQTDVLGKEHIKIIKEHPLNNIASNIQWIKPSGSDFATPQEMSAALLSPCGNNGVCTDASNPTGLKFDNSGTYTVGAEGTVTLSSGTVISINLSTQVEISKYPSRVTYNMPTNSTMSATAAAALFSSSIVSTELAEVIGDDTNNTLTFVCKPDEYIDPVAINLADGTTQLRSAWTIINTAVPTPYFNGSEWKTLQLIAAANNSTGFIVGTGVDCGIPF